MIVVFQEFVDRLAAQRVVLAVSPFAFGSIIGKNGAVAKALRVRAAVLSVLVRPIGWRVSTKILPRVQKQ